MQVIDYIFIVLGVFSIGWGIYSLLNMKFSKSRTDVYTLESLKKYAIIEGIFTIISGIGVILAGLGNSGAVLPTDFLYVGWAIVIVVLILEFVLEPKILKKLEVKEEANKKE